MRVDPYPKVIVSDKDLTLMNAIGLCFLKLQMFYVAFILTKMLKQSVKLFVHPIEVWDQVMEAWGSVVDCDDPVQFEHHVQAFQVFCSPWPIFVDYIIGTWLVSHKEKFVKAWTDRLMHLGNTTINRYIGIILTLMYSIIENRDVIKFNLFVRSRLLIEI